MIAHLKLCRTIYRQLISRNNQCGWLATTCVSAISYALHLHFHLRSTATTCHVTLRTRKLRTLCDCFMLAAPGTAKIYAITTHVPGYNNHACTQLRVVMAWVITTNGSGTSGFPRNASSFVTCNCVQSILYFRSWPKRGSIAISTPGGRRCQKCNTPM